MISLKCRNTFGTPGSYRGVGTDDNRMTQGLVSRGVAKGSEQGAQEVVALQILKFASFFLLLCSKKTKFPEPGGGACHT